jgi:alpha-L-fucosidase 2
MANLTTSITGVLNYTNYKRSLDISKAIHTTTFDANEASFKSTIFCSYPNAVCVYNLESNKDLPSVDIAFENQYVSQSLVNLTCGDGFARLTGFTQLDSPEGLKYETIVRIVGNVTSKCTSGKLAITPMVEQTSFTLVVGAGSEYDQTMGNAKNEFSFKGVDPGPQVSATTNFAAKKSYLDLLGMHLQDYTKLFDEFELYMPDMYNSSDVETGTLLANYSVNSTGNPYVESLLFDYSRYLLIASSREDSLPTNLQGRWTEKLNPDWSSDYHANINFQMNYWTADQTGLGYLAKSMWDYMENTWVPRGTETAQLLYNASGWVTHNEMNIFGHTGMKEQAEWADYPASAAWMMLHVLDAYDYSRDAAWYKSQGYPLIKGVAQFWLSQLQDDLFFNDGTLVVNPCNSPEQGPPTFGCTHYQQLIHQIFDGILSTASIAEENDESFLSEVMAKLSILDKGIHIDASTGVLQEWKVPDSYLWNIHYQHRHLSHLIGWFPGTSIAALENGYTSPDIQAAVKASLIARGAGVGNDGAANNGWSKVWRAACWARLNNTEEAFYELRLAIDTNFAPNGLSMYNAAQSPLQIDANFGLGGAMLSMLVVDLPLPVQRLGEVRTIVLGPAIPSSWAGGKVKGLRVRGGGVVDFTWNSDGLVTSARIKESKTSLRIVNKAGDVLVRI